MTSFAASTSAPAIGAKPSDGRSPDHGRVASPSPSNWQPADPAADPVRKARRLTCGPGLRTRRGANAPSPPRRGLFALLITTPLTRPPPPPCPPLLPPTRSHHPPP